MKKINFERLPFSPLIATSLGLSCAHAIAQVWWKALRFQTLGPRPLTAKALILLEVLLQMAIFTIAIPRIWPDESDSGVVMPHVIGSNAEVETAQKVHVHQGKYILGWVVALGAWIIANFVL